MKGKLQTRFSMKSYNQLFKERFYNSQIIDETFSKIFNTEGLKSGIDYLKSIGATKLDIENYQIKYGINKWTQNDLNEEEKKKLLNELLELKNYVSDVKIAQNTKFDIPEVKIQTTDGLISAMRFSTYKPNIKKIIPDIENEKRFGNCYKYAYYISIGFPLPNNLTTGYIYGYSDKSKFLHSWIETAINGEEYVIDATLNAIINRKGYYLMQHAKPINKISSKTFREDLNNYSIIDNKNIPLEVYYVFRDEIIKEFEKKKDELER